MNEYYHQTITELEQGQVARDYIIGWASGYLGNPEIEEQRLTEAWQAGYGDGKAKNTDQSASWRETGA